MFRTASFILRLLLALVLLAGVLGAVAMAFRAGYSQGYALGAATEGDAPQLNPGYRMVPGMMPYARPHFFPPFGLFFCGGFFFLILLAGIFRPRHWHHHAAWTHGPWSHEHPHDPGHAPESKPESKPADAA